MKIVKQRGEVVTGEAFRQRLRQVINLAIDGSTFAPEDSNPTAPPTAEAALRETQALGFQPDSQSGKAAAGAAMLSQALSAGIRKYQDKTGKPVTPEIINQLEEQLTQLFCPDPAKQPSYFQQVKRGKTNKLSDL